MFTTFLKITSLTSVCVASLLLAGNVFAGPHSGSPSRSTGSRMSTPSRQGTRGTMVASNRGEKTPLRATRFGTNRNYDRNYHRTHGHAFSHGYYYQGRNHSHWSHYCWWGRFGCYAYWCPSTSCYYYWSETASCYYPVSYAEVVTPTASTQLLNVNNNNNNTNVVTNNAPAPVAPAIPVGPIAGSTVGAELPPPTE